MHPRPRAFGELYERHARALTVARWMDDTDRVRSVAAVAMTSLVLGIGAVGAAGAGPAEYPFGGMSVAPDGTLYYVDRWYGRIDEVTAGASSVVLSSLRGGAPADRSIRGLGGLAVAAGSLWFTAGGGLYRATLDGRDVRRLGMVPGATRLAVLADRTVLYTTASAVYERAPNGRVARVAGGGTIPFREQVGEHRATALADLSPVSVAGVSAQVFYFTNENNLYRVDRGEAEMLRPLLDFSNGELASGPRGSVYGICQWAMCRIRGHTFTRLFRLPTRIGGRFTAPDALAVSPAGSFYVSYSSQSGTTGTAGIAELTATGHVDRIVTSRMTYAG